MKLLLKEIEKSFSKLEKLFTKEMLIEFSHTRVNRLEKYNFGLGTMIQLKLLRPQYVLYKKFVEYGFTDSEEMTMKIIIEFHKYISQKNQTF